MSRVVVFWKSTAVIAILMSVGCSSSTHSTPQPANDAETFSSLREALDSAHEALGAQQPLTSSPLARALPTPSHPSVEAAVRYFAGERRPTIQSSFDRSAPYREMIERELQRQGLPPELGFLPVIESGFRPDLTSRAGAHGMWQFMPATAREYGLRVDWWVDERSDPERSTHAAVTYLRDLYAMFDDWPLALAAYNCGPGRVRRTLDRTGAKSFWELLDMGELPKETRGYVPTFFATAVLASNPRGWNFTVPSPSPWPDTPSVLITGPVSIDYIARAAGLPSAELTGLNRSLRRGVVPPGAHPVKVPASIAPTIMSRASRMYLEDPDVRVASYTLRPGETLDRLADRLSIDPDVLRAMNDSVASATIYLPLDQRSLNARLAVSTTPDAHVVVRGETLYSIARANDLSVDELMSINGLEEGHVIRPGDRLVVALSTLAVLGR